MLYNVLLLKISRLGFQLFLCSMFYFWGDHPRPLGERLLPENEGKDSIHNSLWAGNFPWLQLGLQKGFGVAGEGRQLVGPK